MLYRERRRQRWASLAKLVTDDAAGHGAAERAGRQ